MHCGSCIVRHHGEKGQVEKYVMQRSLVGFFWSFVRPHVETFLLASLKLSSLPVGSALTAGLNCEVRPAMPEATERGCN